MGDMRTTPDKRNAGAAPAPHGQDGADISRSQRRREALDILRLAHALAGLSDAQLAGVPIADDLAGEVRRARAVHQQIARKRQTQYLAKQMRKLDDDALAAIRAALEHDRDLARRDSAALHQVEAWRERLVEDGDEALGELLGAFPAADRQRLRQLARQARAERDGSKPLHAYRELFRLLRELIDAAPSA